MNVRHLATKNFEHGVEIANAAIFNGMPIIIRGEKISEETYGFVHDESVHTHTVEAQGREIFQDSPLSSVIIKNDGIDTYSLSQIYNYSVEGNDELGEIGLPVGTSFDDIIEDADMKEEIVSAVVGKLFPNNNPNTGKPDVDKTAYYAPYVALVTVTGCMPPQLKDGDSYFNPEGVVTVAEFLDGLNSIKFGANSNRTRKKTLDNISDEKDYFNEGYQSCLSGFSSPFFNLYTRAELMQPITRLEMAYLTVVCWEGFIEKYNNLYGSNQYYLGVNFDWVNPKDLLAKFEDGFDYKVSRISIDKENSVCSLNIKDYRSDRSMTEYLEDIKSGVAAIPLPCLMSLVELYIVDLFHFEEMRLDPLKEVSRAELCYFLVRLAKLFPTKYIR